MAVRTSRKIVIEATPEAIMDALADVEALPSYSPAYKRAEVLDRYEDNRPHHVRIAVKVLGIVDEEVLEYRKTLIDAATEGLRNRVLRGW